MTDQQSHPTTFGSIHDYLKRVNGETADLGIPWRNKGQQNKASEAASDTTKPSKTKLPEADEQDRSSTNEAQIEKEPQVKEPKAKKKRTKPYTPQGAGKTTHSKRPSVLSESKGKKSSIKTDGSFEERIEAFDQMKEKGWRHHIFIPNDVYNALQLAYGERRLSAFFTVLAREFIATHKEDMKQRIALRINLLSDSTDQ